MSFANLDTLCRKLEAIGHAQAILGVDEAVSMPEGGGEKRAEAFATLAGIYHAAATAPEVADWIAAAAGEDLPPAQQTALREFRRVHTNLTALPAQFVERQTGAAMRTEQLWRALRPKGDWGTFAAALTEVVAMAREEAGMRAAALDLDPYDALMEQYDPGNRMAEITPVFADLRKFLKSFLPEALEAQNKRFAARPLKPVLGTFPVEDQRQLGLACMLAIGFDFDHGRLDISHHPFCGGVPTDVRMTTRYRTDDFLSSLMAVLHETGHGMYEQGLPKAGAHWPSADARGMAMHESQSLFNEMQIARSDEFWHWAMPLVKEHIGEAVADWQPEDVIAHVNLVEPGLIRVDADEVTYPLHVILRYEIEQDLISGKMEVHHIPEVWDAKMHEYLGLRTHNDPSNGPMQDVHWSGGAFGYFPSYTLGAMMAAQQWAAMEKKNPNARAQIAQGDFTEINRWRSENIWLKASTASTPDLMTAATGEPLNAKYFEAHLRKRYGA